MPEGLHYSGLLTKFRILLDGESVPEKSFIFNQKKEERTDTTKKEIELWKTQ